ncbi:hypothetical protein FRB93_009338 [Tulasnella sp. JGI-2019a]|nr:hypothetical protein FRB93_009338 [Tulasnella sp. JGI-2019a]
MDRKITPESTSAIVQTLKGKRPLLLQRFKGIVATPSDGDTYKVERWATNAIQQAAYVVFPTDAEDISIAILFARQERLPLAISGGRHNAAGSSSSKGGLVIDMRYMYSVRVDMERKIGYIQGGTTSRHALSELNRYRLATTVGLCGAVGVIGVATGGGIGFSTGQYGLACDNIVSATVVVASGEIIQVDESTNSDLLWGIKGGGSNFGVIAELGMRLHEPRTDAYYLECLYLPEKLPVLVAELNAWFEGQTPQESLTLAFVRGPHDGNPYIMLSGVASLSLEAGESHWDRFQKLGPAVTKSKQITYHAMSSLHDFACELPGAKVMAGAHFNSFTYETVQKTYDIWLRATLIGPSSLVMYELWEYTNVSKVPIEATAFSQRTTDKIALIAIMGMADIPGATKVCEELRISISSSSTDSAKESIGYLNYAQGPAADNATDAHARKAFGANYPRLQALKRKYDPEMVFNKWFCIKPANA